MIIDTGLLIAAASRRDRHHEAARTILSHRGTKVIPEPVVVETCYMMGSRLGQDVELAFLQSLQTRTFVVEQITRTDRARIIELLEGYKDAMIGYVDAAVAAVAERLRDGVIATLDRRDFTLIRPRHVEAFTLVPEAPS